MLFNRLTANQRASIARAVLEMGANYAYKNTIGIIYEVPTGSITSRCSENEPALLLPLVRTGRAAEIESG